MYEDSRGNIWFGTSNLGIYLFDGTEISWMYENHLIETPEGGNFGVRSIAEDQDGEGNTKSLIGQEQHDS